MGNGKRVVFEFRGDVERWVERWLGERVLRDMILENRGEVIRVEGVMIRDRVRVREVRVGGKGVKWLVV